MYRPEDEGRLNVVVASSDDDEEPQDLDTFNTPAALFIDVFFEACSSTETEGNPFEATVLGEVRSALLECTGQPLLRRWRNLRFGAVWVK